MTSIDGRSANFIGATLTGVCIQDWTINSETKLDSVICDYIFLKQNEEGKFIERRPHNGNFGQGKFVELYLVSLETTDVIFQGGIDWQAFLTSFQQVQAEAQTDELAIQAIERKKDTFIVRLEAPSTFDKEAIERSIKEKYDRELALVEARYQGELHAKNQAIEIYRQQGANMMEIAKLLASRSPTVEAKVIMSGSKDFSGAIVGGNVNDASGSNITNSNVAGRDAGDITYNNAPSTDIEGLKTEVRELWEEIAGDRPTETRTQQGAIVEDIENDPTLRQRFARMLAAVGKQAFKEAIDHPIANILVAAIEEWQEE